LTGNVQTAMKRHGIKYPVAQDNDYATWNAYHNQYWPAQYIIDRNGTIVFEHAGEGQYDEIERTIKAILAFSPGEYLRGPSTVRKAAAQVSIPIFVTSAKDAKEIAVAKSILDASPSVDKIQFIPQIAGIHGSSTLRKDQNPDGVEENWRAVKHFLAKFLP
jgi:hypothetical protein